MYTVYLVDDEQMFLDQFLKRRQIFWACGFEIVGFETDPRRALKAIRDTQPDAVFSDLKMPVLDGIGLLTELSLSEKPPVFVIVSAYSELRDVRKLFKKHGFDYILKPIDSQTLISLLDGVADRIKKLPPVLEIETPSRELNEILIALKEHPAMEHTLESISGRFGMHPSTVCNLFSKHLNTTFLAYLTKLRMEKAEEFLRATDLMIKEISAQCGYPDRFYFTRAFTKAHNGITPTEYREAARCEK